MLRNVTVGHTRPRSTFAMRKELHGFFFSMHACDPVPIIMGLCLVALQAITVWIMHDDNNYVITLSRKVLSCTTSVLLEDTVRKKNNRFWLLKFYILLCLLPIRQPMIRKR